MKTVRSYLLGVLGGCVVVLVLAVVIRPYIEWLVLGVVVLTIAGMLIRRG